MTRPFATSDFAALVAAQINLSLVEQAARAVNVSLTLRNWLVGAYIRDREMPEEEIEKFLEEKIKEAGADNE